MALIFAPDPSPLRNFTASPANRLPSLLLLSRPAQLSVAKCPNLGLRRSFAVSASASDTFTANSSKNGVLTVGDFMTRREDLHVVNPTTTVDEAIELLVENRITGFPVIDSDWKLVGLVSDYDLLALDTISGGLGNTDNSMFPEVDSSWQVYGANHNRCLSSWSAFIGTILDSSFVPPLIYSLLGSSRHLAVGPVSIASLVMGSMLSEVVSSTEEPILYLKLAFTAHALLVCSRLLLVS